MKYIIAVIQPDKLGDVLEQLEEREVHVVTVWDMMGRERQRASPRSTAVTWSRRSGPSVLDLEQCPRIRTGETASVAIGQRSAAGRVAGASSRPAGVASNDEATRAGPSLAMSARGHAAHWHAAAS